MRNFVRYWYFDVSSDSSANFDVFDKTILCFINFIHGPADEMSVGNPDSLVIVGDVIGGSRVAIGGISLISKITKNDSDAYRLMRNNGGTGADGSRTYRVITNSGIYYLVDADMDAGFRRDFIYATKIVPFRPAATL